MFKRDADCPRVLAPPPVIYAAFFLAGFGLDHWIHPLPIFDKTMTSTGWVIVAIGLGMVAWAVILFHRAGTPVDPGRTVSAIVTTGPYRFSRNPIYLALFLIYAGGAVLLGVFWPVILAPFLKMTMDLGVIRREEQYLSEKFGDDYRTYLAAAPRWFSFRTLLTGPSRTRQ